MANTKNFPRIVSILTLNRLDLTKKAAESVLTKRTEDVRIVFFDNGSKDGTLEYLEELKMNFPKEIDILTSEVNLGVAGGRNRVFKFIISKYGNNFKWVLNLDNDCIVHKGFDVAISKCINETGAAAVCPRLIQPDGRIFHNAHQGFLIDLENMKLKLEYADSVKLLYDDPLVSKRIQTDVILGTSAKTPEFFDKVGFYDEGHKIGWEDFSIALKALGIHKEDYLIWKKANKHGSGSWIPLKRLMGDNREPIVKVCYEPSCMITHNHPVTEEHRDYEKIRWKDSVIQESTNHFQNVWGLKPVL